jgi:protein TonB
MRNPVPFLLGLLLMGTTAMVAQQSLGDVARQTRTQETPDTRVIHREPPIYPAEAKAKGISGTVIVEVVIGRQGNVSSAKVIEGDKIFQEAALTAVKAWKFQPPTTQELPVERIIIRFEPKSGAQAK